MIQRFFSFMKATVCLFLGAWAIWSRQWMPDIMMTVSENGNGSSEKGENPCQRSLNFAEHLLFHAVSANAGCNLRNPFPELVHRHQAAAFQLLQGFVQKRCRIDRLRQVLVAKQTPGGLLGDQHTPRLRQCLHRVLLCSYFVGGI